MQTLVIECLRASLLGGYTDFKPTQGDPCTTPSVAETTVTEVTEAVTPARASRTVDTCDVAAVTGLAVSGTVSVMTYLCFCISAGNPVSHCNLYLGPPDAISAMYSRIYLYMQK